MGNQSATVTFGNDHGVGTLDVRMTYEIVRRASKGNTDGFVFSGRGEAATLSDFDVQNRVGHMSE